ncbi:MAG: hypothetical protein WAM53_09110 [Terrimicrobiaceae bacterium]
MNIVVVRASTEQKNGAVIRRTIGYERLSGIVASQALAQLFQFVDGRKSTRQSPGLVNT